MQLSSNSNVNIFTDGSSTKTKNGGSGILFISDSQVIGVSIVHHNNLVTNNICELSALLIGVKLSIILNSPNTSFTIATDSQYSQKGFNEWIHNWRRNGWKNNTGAEIANKNLWLAADSLKRELITQKVNCKVRWVKGHAGNAGNEVADRLACNKILIDTESKFLELLSKYSIDVSNKKVELLHLLNTTDTPIKVLDTFLS